MGVSVTIGISTYNRAAGYFPQALASALAQRYAPLEILVCDNGSTDGTAEVVAAMADERVRYVRQPTNIGPTRNFNVCVAEASGDYFLLLHDDDMLDHDMIEAAMRPLAAEWPARRPGAIRTGTRVVDAQGQQLYERENRASGGSVADLMFDWFDGRTSLYLCSTLYRTDALREAGSFTSPREQYLDVAALMRVVHRYGALEVKDVKATFRRHGGNSGSAQTIESWCEDSRYLIDLACELEPERADELRARGLAYFSNNNYARVARYRGVLNRARAYWAVYRAFDSTTPPWRHIGYRWYLRAKRALRRGA